MTFTALHVSGWRRPDIGSRTLVTKRARCGPVYWERHRGHHLTGGTDMTFIWFIVWLIANNVGGHKPLLFDPVNIWAGTLILAIALDLGAAHARTPYRRGG